jgi:hypothetical protein
VHLASLSAIVSFDPATGRAQRGNRANFFLHVHMHVPLHVHVVPGMLALGRR